MSYPLPPEPRVPSARRPGPRAAATIAAAVVAALLSLAEFGVLGDGAGIALRCDLRAVAAPATPAAAVSITPVAPGPIPNDELAW